MIFRLSLVMLWFYLPVLNTWCQLIITGNSLIISYHGSSSCHPGAAILRPGTALSRAAKSCSVGIWGEDGGRRWPLPWWNGWWAKQPPTHGGNHGEQPSCKGLVQLEWTWDYDSLMMTCLVFRKSIVALANYLGSTTWGLVESCRRPRLRRLVGSVSVWKPKVFS